MGIRLRAVSGAMWPASGHARRDWATVLLRASVAAMRNQAGLAEELTRLLAVLTDWADGPVASRAPPEVGLAFGTILQLLTEQGVVLPEEYQKIPL